MTSSPGFTTLLLLTVWFGYPSHCQMLRRPSPASEFLLHPSNITVPEGEQTILKCLAKSQVHVCRWYFLELGHDFFGKNVSPMLVKDFKPAQNHDCSIRIKKVRKIQEGQWLCQALKFDSLEMLMTEPAALRVITRSESVSWTPPSDLPPVTTPRQSRYNDEEETTLEKVSFDVTPADFVQNTKLNESAELNCRINKPMAVCTWIMPNGSSFSVSQNEKEFNKPEKFTGDYRLKGDLRNGQCSLHVGKVQPQDEGDWHCIVQVMGHEEEYQGPFLHLHITNLPYPVDHNHDGEPLVAPTEGSSSVLVIVLVLTSTILLILVILLFSCLYRRVAAASEESHKILQASPQSSLNHLPHKTFPTTDLTAASVLAVDSVRSSPAKGVDLDQYDQYLDMTGSDNASGSYVMMPPSSLRSSMSSRTTLSTLSILPAGRARSASSSTVLSKASHSPGNLMDNPSYDPSDAPTRPDTLYYADHIYEEIKDKREDVTKMDKIPEVTTPTYTNMLQDYEGYLVPKNTPSSEMNSSHPVSHSTHALSMHTLPRPKAESPANEQAPPYSRVGQCGLVPASPSPEAAPSLGPGPGYSRVGSENPTRENVLTDTMEGYDEPRFPPRPVPLPLNIPVSSEAYVNGLAGITV